MIKRVFSLIAMTLVAIGFGIWIPFYIDRHSEKVIHGEVSDRVFADRYKDELARKIYLPRYQIVSAKITPDGTNTGSSCADTYTVVSRAIGLFGVAYDYRTHYICR